MPIESRRNNGDRPQAKKGFLARLLRDASGNTLAIVGAALVPLAGMIGSGVDMSRAYMAKTRLQSACDSAALAGRRIMEGDTLTPEVEAEAERFFAANFPTGLYETAPFEPVVTRPETGTVRVEASTTIPTAIMHLFGFETLPLNVSCDASLNFVNTDIILVLDVTGSMAWNIDGSDTTNVPIADQRITALREAVMALYEELEPIQEQLEANGLRLRFGVVPYSSTVNVGQLIRAAEDENPGDRYFVDNAEYQTRVANYTDDQYSSSTTQDPPVVQTYGSSISQTNCDRYGRNVSFSGFSPSATSGGTFPGPTWTRTFSNNEASGVDWGWSGAPDSSGDNRSCRRRYVERDTTYTLLGFAFVNWSYEAESINLEDYLDGEEIELAYDSGNNSPGGLVPTAGAYDLVEAAAAGNDDMDRISSTWNGCIEERQTVSTIVPDDAIVEDNDNLSIPANAFDLDIDLVPNSDASRWRPMWPRMAFRRTAGSVTATNGTAMNSAACPAAAVRLRAWTEAEMQTYVNALSPVGSTYHDTGMIWGARLLSPDGIFGDSPDEYNGMPVSRHIIFMSDGEISTDRSNYALYGIEQNERRIAGNWIADINGDGDTDNDDLSAFHEYRFRMICNRAKTLPASIWTIALGMALSDAMTECASNANQASTIASKDDLIERFREIGSNIGALRLTQ